MTSSDYWSGASNERLALSGQMAEMREVINHLRGRVASLSDELERSRIWSMYLDAVTEMAREDRDRMQMEIQNGQIPRISTKQQRMDRVDALMASRGLHVDREDDNPVAFRRCR